MKTETENTPVDLDDLINGMIGRPKDGVWNDLLVCRLQATTSIYANTVELYLPKGDCCDMTGAIKLSEALNPACEAITVFSGDRLDSFYQIQNRKWRSVPQLDAAAFSIEEALASVQAATKKG
jgi:hypothetical protein